VTRIIGGTLGGRRLVLPADARVRPTSDRVREAWFSIVAPELAGAHVVDLCAGSGALGLEALSRGAVHATFVEILPASLAAIRRNAEALGLAERVRVVRRDVLQYLDSVEGLAFDVAFADPPYGHGAAERLVARYRQDPFARVLGVEHPAGDAVEGDQTRRYGDTSLTFCYAL
jgi:16S rRNA (guanine966-N2)-methyltransferase